MSEDDFTEHGQCILKELGDLSIGIDE